MKESFVAPEGAVVLEFQKKSEWSRPLQSAPHLRTVWGLLLWRTVGQLNCGYIRKKNVYPFIKLSTVWQTTHEINRSWNLTKTSSNFLVSIELFYYFLAIFGLWGGDGIVSLSHGFFFCPPNLKVWSDHELSKSLHFSNMLLSTIQCWFWSCLF